MRGKKEVVSLTSAERENLITVVTCMNATGTSVPPLIVFPTKKYERRAYGRSAGGLSRLAVQVVGFRLIYLLNGLIFFFLLL